MINKARIIAIILTSFALTNCKDNTPKRVGGIPEEAFWVGGKCRGLWYLIDRINEKKKTLHCNIYNDRSGKLLFNSFFILECYDNNKEIDWNNLEDQIIGTDWGFDGKQPNILLKKRFPEDKTCHFVSMNE